MAGGSGTRFWPRSHDQKPKQFLTVFGNVVLKDTENSYIYSKNGLIAFMGVNDLLVVQDGNATLVMKRKESENIKILVEYLRSNGFKEYI
jgi:mannose-1-phosphate guanylyltransferase